MYFFTVGDTQKSFLFINGKVIGLKFSEDITIKITGLRPGEKFYEELLADGENTIATHHAKIMIAKQKQWIVKW